MDASALFLLLLSFLSLILLFAMAGLIYLIIDSVPQFKFAREQREQLEILRHNVYQLRLSKMLAYLGIHMHDYLQRIPLADIKTHIAQCKACPNIPSCDRCLRDREFTSDMHFCPNYPSLIRYSRIMPSVG